MDKIQPPPQLKLAGGNLADRWERFKDSLQWYLEATNLATANETRKIAILLTVAGSEAQEVFRTFKYNPAKPATATEAAVPEETAKQYETVLNKFTEFCVPRKNVIYERYVFHTRVQKEEEQIDSFITDLRLKSKTCEFENLRDSLIRDRVVVGIRDSRLKEKLLRDPGLTLERAVDVCKANEAAQAQMKVLTGSTPDDSSSVHAVKKGRSKKGKPKHAGNDSQEKPKAQQDGQNAYLCRRCGKTHQRRECPAWGQVCKKCNGHNHFASQCKAKRVQMVGVDSEDSDSSSEDSDSDFYVSTVSKANREKQCEWIANLTVNSSIVPLKLDCGSQVNILNLTDYSGLKLKPKLVRRDVPLKSYTEEPIDTVGVCTASVEVKKKSHQVKFVVVPGETQSLLGAFDCERLGLLKRSNTVRKVYSIKTHKELSPEVIQQEYGDIFKGLGCLEGEGKIYLIDNATPSIYPARKVPFALRERLKAELARLEELDVIKKADKPTEWVLPLVIVEKPNKDLRICMDPMDLNQCIKREHYHLPHKSEILSEMAGAKFFSKMDAAQGFYQCKLDEQSSQLCTVATPFGRYSFKRLPYGISCAPELFHAKIQQLFDQHEGVKIFMDDIVVWGSTREQHDERLKKALDTIRKSGLKMNAKKCKFAEQEITFLGDKIGQNGVRPDPEKIAGISDMPTPTCTKDVQRILGMVNYLAKFVPNMSTRTTALRKLLHEDIEWQWEAEHEREWQDIKKFLTEEPVLQFFDQDKKIRVSSDASKDGMGGVLLQEHDGNWLPVAFTSRAMTPAECNYAQIEKELLGLVMATEKFHEYIYGATIEAETDHKPLISLHTKNLSELTPRLQRLMLRLRRYDLKLSYTPGKYLVLADALSRAYNKTNTESSSEREVAMHVNMIKENTPVSDPMWNKIAEHTERDPILSQVVNALEYGWESDRARNLKPYYHFRGEIAEVDGVLLKGSKIIIPESLKEEMLTIIHEGHMSAGKCQERARQVVYWPNINRDIDTKISKCEVCLKFKYQQPKEPLQPHDIPNMPWVKIGADLFSWNGQDYLVVVDYTSNYPEVARLEDLSSQTTISHMKSIMSRRGIPRIVVSDNGPQFSGHEFSKFAKNYGFDHTTSSPGFPQSNGRAENAVKTVKRLFKKAKESGGDPYIALLNYRSTPLSGEGESPDQISRKGYLRTNLPSVTDHSVTYRVKNSKQKLHYDRGSKQLPTLERNDTVRIRRDGVWAEKAKVLSQAAQNSYNIKLESGRCLRRNRRHIMKTKEQFKSQPEPTEPVDLVPTVQPKPAGVQECIDKPLETVVSKPQPNITTSTPPPQSPAKMTRSGRVVKPPARFDD